jgi:site-specific DNA-methyltransferase (adenine-specific)/modification methylase
VELGRYLIRTFSNPGDVLLDNTSGAGSFLVSALMEQRNFVGIEKNQDARLFKEESINLIKISNDRIYKAFFADTKLAFSSYIQRCGVIKEFILNGQNRIAI